MALGDKGVWSAEAPCGHGTYYTYTVTTAVGTQEAVDNDFGTDWEVVTNTIYDWVKKNEASVVIIDISILPISRS